MIRVAFVPLKIGICVVVLGLLINARISRAQYGNSQNSAPLSLEQEIRRVEAEIDKILADTLAQVPSLPSDTSSPQPSPRHHRLQPRGCPQ